MGNCNFTLKLDGKTFSFDSEIGVKKFVKDNYFRIKSLNGINNVSFSKNTDIFSENEAKIQAILDQNQNLPTETDEFGERWITATGYTGINRYIEGATGENGKQLTSRFDEDNYIKNMLDKEISNLKKSGEFSNYTDDELKEKAIDNLKNNIKEFKQLGSFGTELHYISDLFFKNGYTGTEEVYNSLKKKFPDSNFNRNVVEKMLTYVKDTADKIYKKHGENAKIYTEIAVHDPETKLVGIIDMLVLDERGKTHIYDYKTSHKRADDWANAKLNKMKYQMAFYNQLLLKKGLITNSVNLLPIEISNIDYSSNIVNDIDIEQQPMNITQAINSSFYKYEAQRHIPVDTSNFLSDNSEENDIKEELKQSFGYAIQTNLDSNGFKIKTNKNGEKYFRDLLTGKNEKLTGTDEENQQKIDKYKRDYATSENHEISKIKDNIRNYLRTDENSINNMGYSDAQKTIFEKLFRPYKNLDWEMIDDDRLDALGIVAFQNNMTKTIDFVSFTSNKLGTIAKLNKGKTILGNFSDDRSLFQEKGLLNATTYNIEGMKIAMWINSNHELFKKFDYNIGDMRVATTNMYDIQGINSKQIINNYQRLTQKSQVQYNLQDVKHSNPFDLLLSKVSSIFNESDNIETFGSAKYVLTDIERKLNGEPMGSSFYTNLSAEQIKQKLELLNEISDKIRYLVDPEKLDLNNDVHFIYSLAQQAITYYSGLEVGYVDDMKEWALNESEKASSIQNIANPVIKMVLDVYNRSRSNIGTKFNKFDSDFNKVLNSYFNSVGFNRAEQVVLGKMKDVYSDLWEKDERSNIDSDFRLRDPYTDKRLSENQRTFLKEYLEKLNSYRFKTQDEIEQAKKSGEYFNVPLIKARGITRLKQKGVLNTVKQSWNYSMDFNNFFEDETQENRNRAKAQDYLYNQFKSQEVEDKRNQMIEENGVEEFEQDLQTVLKVYALTNIKEQEFNKVLPVINAVRTTARFKNNGLSNGVTEHLDNFIKNYVKTVIFNEKLIEPQHEKYIKIASKMKEVTSMGLLAFNFSAGVRDFFQGILTNTVNTAAKSFGYDIDGKALSQAYAFVTKESLKSTDNIDLMDSMNKKYMVSMMDINMLADRSVIGQNGLLTFRSEQLYWFNAIPDFYNRMTLFIAKMIQDGSLNAHKVVDGELKYDWRFDKRFDIYAKGAKNHPDYDKQKGMYLTLLHDFNAQNLTDVPLKEGDALPQAYTYKDIESLKSFSNLIHGYYDQDAKMQFQQTWFGVSFMQFKGWLKAKVDQQLLSRNVYNVGNREQGTQDGELLWFKTDDNGNTIITKENTGVPYYPVTGSIMEGVLVSWGRLLNNIYTSKGNVSEAMKLLKEDKLMKGNITKSVADVAVFSIIAALCSSIDWPEFKEESPYLGRFAWTVSKAGDDLFVVNNLKAVVSPQSMVPSFSYLIKAADTVPTFFNNPNAGARAVMNQSGMLRPFSYIIPK